MYSSSLLGRVATLDRSRYAESGFIPGADEDAELVPVFGDAGSRFSIGGGGSCRAELCGLDRDGAMVAAF